MPKVLRNSKGVKKANGRYIKNYYNLVLNLGKGRAVD